jgi:hypothetical protein
LGTLSFKVDDEAPLAAALPQMTGQFFFPPARLRVEAFFDAVVPRAAWFFVPRRAVSSDAPTRA